MLFVILNFELYSIDARFNANSIYVPYRVAIESNCTAKLVTLIQLLQRSNNMFARNLNINHIIQSIEI